MKIICFEETKCVLHEMYEDKINVAVLLLDLVLVSLHVSVVHLHRVKLNVTHRTCEGVGCKQE